MPSDQRRPRKDGLDWPCEEQVCSRTKRQYQRRMIHRRTLLSLLLMTSLVPATARCAPPSNRRVVIVGAGIAGLGAAVALRSAGMEVVIVEARNRIGGRIHTSTMWPEFSMDLGASWIHGTRGNPVTALATQAGAATVGTSYDSTLLHIGPELRALGATNGGTEASEALLEHALAWAARQDRDVSLQSALDAIAPPASLDNIRRAQLDFYVSGTYEQEYSGGSRQLSAWSMDKGKEFGGEDVLFPGGYSQITAYLARGLDIRLSHVVTSITTRPSGTTLAFADGSMLEADDVLLTVPLGVLKAGKIAFDPPLSAPKRQAIGRLGMGLLNKHWLRFDRVRWPRDFDWHEYLSMQKGKWSEWVSLAKVSDTPVLMVFSAADHAETVEQMNDRDIVANIMDTARKMFGTDLPDPTAAQITRWRADPFAGGSYSFYATGSGPADRANLAASEGERLHFAGEAQSLNHPGTVHGALLSGREAAARIIQGGGR